MLEFLLFTHLQTITFCFRFLDTLLTKGSLPSIRFLDAQDACPCGIEQLKAVSWKSRVAEITDDTVAVIDGGSRSLEM